jgi:hypothetical protein
MLSSLSCAYRMPRKIQSTIKQVVGCATWQQFWPEQRYVSIVGCNERINNARNKQSTALRITITPPIKLLPIIYLARINITLYKNQVRQYLVGLGRTSHFGALIIVVVIECNEITFTTELTNCFFFLGMYE